MSRTRIDGFANDAAFPARSVSRTPRALEQAPQTWIGMPSATVVRSVSASGGQPTGTTAFATGSRNQRDGLAEEKDLRLVPGLDQRAGMQERERRLGGVVGAPRALHENSHALRPPGHGIRCRARRR